MGKFKDPRERHRDPAVRNNENASSNGKIQYPGQAIPSEKVRSLLEDVKLLSSEMRYANFPQ